MAVFRMECGNRRNGCIEGSVLLFCFETLDILTSCHEQKESVLPVSPKMRPDPFLFDGVLNLNKPAGVTSRDVVNQVQRVVRPVKVGHAGTLDPMATGVLLVCLGPATRLVTLLQSGTKTYRSRFILGETSDTDDSTGVVLRNEEAAECSRSELEAALKPMIGVVRQIPPAYSAVHVQGQRAYERARRGESLTLTAKEVRIESIRILEFSWPVLDLEIRCGSGTYIRSIARDLGISLGCGGLMSRLTRTGIGTFRIEDSFSPDLLDEETIIRHLTPTVGVTENMPRYECDEKDVADILCGRHVQISYDRLIPAGDCNAVKAPLIALTRSRNTELVALGSLTDAEKIHAHTVLISLARR